MYYGHILLFCLKVFRQLILLKYKGDGHRTALRLVLFFLPWDYISIFVPFIYQKSNIVKKSILLRILSLAVQFFIQRLHICIVIIS